MKMSLACAANEHGQCDGTTPGNAADDATFLGSLPENERRCACGCHLFA